MSVTSSLTIASWTQRRTLEILGSSSTGNRYVVWGFLMLISLHNIEVVIHWWCWVGLYIASVIDRLVLNGNFLGYFMVKTKGNERHWYILADNGTADSFTVIALTGIRVCGHSMPAGGQTDARGALRLGSFDAQGHPGRLLLRRRPHSAPGPLVSSRRGEDLSGVAQVRK